MNFYWIKTPYFIKRLFRNLIWDVPNAENKIYLTFDDGPTPEVTEWVLEILKTYNTKATFFCIGDNIRKHPEIFQKLFDAEHAIANHTYNHLNGWKTKNKAYLNNIMQCEKQIQDKLGSSPFIFRPPYGKIKSSQSRKLKKLGYKVIMWDVLSADFDTSITPEQCFINATQKVTSGSIIVFHDSLKAKANLEYALPKTIHYLKEKGFIFDTISNF